MILHDLQLLSIVYRIIIRCTDDSFNPESMTADCKDYAVSTTG